MSLFSEFLEFITEREGEELRLHINILLCAAFVLYLIHDGLPLLLLNIPTELHLSPLQIALLAALASCNLVALFTPQEWSLPSMSFDVIQRQESDEPSPEETCSHFSYYISYGWLSSFIWKGFRKPLTTEDLPPLPSYDEPLLWLPRILQARQRCSSTLWTLAFLLRRELALMVFTSALTGALELIAPLSMYNLLGYLAEPESAVFNPGIWVALLFIGQNCRGVMFRLYLFVSTRLIVRLKISLVQEIFQKALLRDMNRMVSESSESHNQNSEGKNSQEEPAQADRTAIEVANLMSFDVDAITAARDIVLCSVAGPAVVSLSIFLLYQMLGWPSLAGLAVMLMCLGIPMHFAQRLSITQTQAMKATDMRISRISECLQAIRTIKYFAWENAISNNIEEARQIEQGFMWKKALYIIAIVASGDLMPLLSLLVMFSCYVLSTGQPLTSAIAFTSVALVDIIRLQFTLMSSITSKVSQAGVSLHRIDRYFTTSTEVQRHRIGPPSFKNATLSRTSSSGFKLKNLSIDLIENGLNVVMGASGSGKSSLLLSLLGESILESGEVVCHRDVGYAAQSAWLQRDSIRNNIIFNGVFEQTRYESVLHACGLDQDIQHLPYADLTLIGENGFTLSGGQRQRVALARAIYSKSSVLLLDDIFSALDVTTAIHVYNQCFCTDLLQNRTIILVTQLPWIAREADFEVKLDRGVVTFADTKQNVLRIPISVSQFMPDEVRPTYDSGTMTPSSQHSEVPTDLLTSSKRSKNFHSPERNFKGLLHHYLIAFGGPIYAILVLCTAFIAQISFFGMNLWLTVWVDNYGRKDFIDVRFYGGVHAALLVFCNLLTSLNSVVFRYGAWYAAKRLHNGMVNGVLGVSLNWYHHISLGRIINRFSRDIDSLDNRLVEVFQRSIDYLIRLLFRVLVIGSVLPIFAIPTAAMCFVGYAIGQVYTRTATSVKRLGSESQSPIFAHFSEILAGLSVVRARAGMTEIMQSQMAAKLRVWARTAEAQYNANRWFDFRSDLAASIVSLGAGTIALVKSGSVSTGLVGFSLTNAIGLGQTTILLFRAMNELEIEMTSFQRVREYADLPTEETSGNNPPVGAEWPSSGNIEFRNVNVRYTANGPDVLKDISFTIKSGDRVAIVGRTGSGKSTLALSCLRIPHISSGSIIYDGINIADLPVRRLRESLSIIPQDTILFGGEIKDNLDPGKALDLHDLENVFNTCSHVRALAYYKNSEELPSKLSLSTKVEAGGANFSEGQRQILGLARALVKRSKLVLLDEATASMDYETDAAIQDLLRSEMKGSTVITIAHRLRSIIDYDRVIVMADGQIVEMGSPKELYQRRGFFKDMVMQCGEAETLMGLLDGSRQIRSEVE